MPNTLGLHRPHCLHRVHLLTCWALFAALSLGACGGGGGSVAPGQPSIVVAMTPAPPAGIVTNAYPGFTFAVASAGSPSPTGKPLQGDHHVASTGNTVLSVASRGAGPHAESPLAAGNLPDFLATL
jgi:hypothetical protein